MSIIIIIIMNDGLQHISGPPFDEIDEIDEIGLIDEDEMLTP